jgi:adenosine kinase
MTIELMNVIVTGSLGFDYIMDFPGRFADRIMPDKLHQISLSFLVETLNKQFGGTAGNIGYTLKLFGIEPYILSPAGRDFPLYKTHLTSHKIPTTYIAVHDNVDTSAYFVMTDKDDNQIGSFYAGAMKYSTSLHIQDVKKKTDLAVLAPNDPKAMMQYVRECKKAGIPYLYDPAFQIGNFTPAELKEGLEGSKILIGNDYEIALIEQKLEISHEELIVMVPILVTTLAAKGSIIETRRDAIHVKPAKPKNDSDPTGAGDAYRSGFLAGYLRGFDLGICGQMGSVAAVYTVEKYGTQTHAFTMKEFITRYKENFGSTLSL